MHENEKAECHTKLENITQDQDISECSLLINKIIEYKHSKIQVKQINKFGRLVKNAMDTIITLALFCFFSKHTSFGGHPHNNNYINIQENSVASGTTITTTTPTAPTTITTSANPSVPAHIVPSIKNKWVINLFTTPSPLHRKPFQPGDPTLL